MANDMRGGKLPTRVVPAMGGAKVTSVARVYRHPGPSPSLIHVKNTQ
jgi:hypothetical protein